MKRSPFLRESRDPHAALSWPTGVALREYVRGKRELFGRLEELRSQR